MKKLSSLQKLSLLQALVRPTLSKEALLEQVEESFEFSKLNEFAFSYEPPPPIPLSYSVKRVVRDSPKQKRNADCLCGSGMKYKLCCGQAGQANTEDQRHE